MCGITGVLWPKSDERKTFSPSLISNLLVMSQTRGKEATGIAFWADSAFEALKIPLTAKEFIRSTEYKNFIEKTPSNANTPYGAFLGHCRLATDGSRDRPGNNQPVISNGLCAVHNGIITNVDKIWENNSELKREFDIDTESLLALLRKNIDLESDAIAAIKHTLLCIEGAYSVIIIDQKYARAYVFSNTGSLYYHHNDDLFLFASEKGILENTLSRNSEIKSNGTYNQVNPGTGFILDFKEKGLQHFSFEYGKHVLAPAYASNKHIRVEPVKSQLQMDWRQPPEKLVRCTKCVLPETMPFIEFDNDGVCNYCHNYEPMTIEGKERLLELIDPYRSKDGRPDCLVMFSGGRDSCYGLHLIKKELGLNPIAYSYDWGVLTDIGRRNQARVCGNLGVEHIIVSANIPRKRDFVRKNLEAWLKKPELGMVPILMAGDKQYFYYANKLKKDLALNLIFNCECPLERSKFKAGFCGINENNRRIFDISMLEKMQLAFWYFKQYCRNPKYFNMSLIDSLGGFLSSYGISHEQQFLFKYFRWDEQKINNVLRSEYDWEIDPECHSTWRIGDGTAAFYNYIYSSIAGFTENDTLRSNQIREGVYSREDALAMIKIENLPRPSSMQWYADIIGFDLPSAISVIDHIPTLYDSERFNND